MKAIFAAGCFWGVQSEFDKVKGVKKTTVGYIGGTKTKPSYEQVCTSLTGHAEAIEIEFDSKVVSYDKLLDIFFKIHNPTTKNRQGFDIGKQYRSAIFYHNEEQKVQAEKSIEKHQKDFDKPIVTKIAKATTFYPAEEYHQKYNKKNGRVC